MKVGKNEGELLGLVDGVAVVGEELGDFVGVDDEGTTVGSFDGSDELGALEGMVVGCTVGLEIVGDSEG